MPIDLAIIGSGNFVRDEHFPAIQASTDFHLKAIFSRSLQPAQKLADGIPDIDIYSENSGPGKGYADLLAREDIKAVVIALPITIQPEYIRQAILAGKHVFSEKPIAKDIATAQQLVQWSHDRPYKGTLWAVGENFRYLTKFLRVAEEMQKLGAVKNFRVNVHTMIKMDSKYYKTEWRRTPDYQGGFVLDGGIHIIAGLRLLLAANNDSLSTVSAQSCLQQPHLAPIDTIDAVLKTQSGATGVMSLSYGSPINDQIFEFTCEGGVVTLNLDTITVNGESFDIPFGGRGVNHEIAGFAASILGASAGENGAVEKRQSPEEALADLEIMEKMLDSAERDGERMGLNHQG